MIAVSCSQKAPNSVNNEYNLLEVSLTDKSLSTNYSSTIRGKQDVEIRPQVSGLITEVRVTEGEIVKKGQTLFVIDQVAYQAALETAKASVSVAQSNVATAQLTADSKKELYAQNVVSEYEMQTAQNSLRSAEAELAQAQAQETNARNNLSFTLVKSPSDGIVGTLPYRVGALVSSTITNPLTTVSDNAEMYVYFSMSENQILSLSHDNGSLGNAVKAMPEVELKLNNGNTYAKKGRVESISGVIDQSTGSVSVRAVFPNEERILLSGGSGSVVFPYKRKNVIVIPQAATFETQDKVYVYKVIDGIAQSTLVEVFSINDGQEYIVESGLATGDIIVAEGVGLLRNGTPVSPKKEQKGE
nr:efflux RND transporter periplasmic adaptor subunit [Parabacteroides sp. Marseille-P3160]